MFSFLGEILEGVDVLTCFEFTIRRRTSSPIVSRPKRKRHHPRHCPTMKPHLQNLRNHPRNHNVVTNERQNLSSRPSKLSSNQNHEGGQKGYQGRLQKHKVKQSHRPGTKRIEDVKESDRPTSQAKGPPRLHNETKRRAYEWRRSGGRRKSRYLLQIRRSFSEIERCDTRVQRTGGAVVARCAVEGLAL